MSNTKQNRGFGWIPDLPDHRDLPYAVTREAVTAVKPKVDLASSQNMPKEIWDQGEIGSCTAHGVGLCYAYTAKKDGHWVGVPSRLWIYYQERDMEGTVNYDSGAYVRDGLKVLANLGVPPESKWGYDIQRFTEKPPQDAYDSAEKHHALRYYSVNQDSTSLRTCLSESYPVTFGFTVYDNFYDIGSDGVLTLPGPKDSVVGGHCVAIVGYDDSTQLFKCRNSWGSSWGDQGYFYMPYAYILDSNLSDDFWTVRIAN